MISLDSAFASFPLPRTQSPAQLDTPGSWGDHGTTPRSIPPAPSPRLGLNQLPENVQLPPSPLPPPPESPEIGHRRGDSLASHSSYRTSLASTRYASWTTRSSTHSFSRGLRTYMDDDTPPVPPAPLRTTSKNTLSRDSSVSYSSSYRSDYRSEKGESYGGFHYGIPTDPHSASGLHDLPEEEGSPDGLSARTPAETHLHPARADPNHDAPRKNWDPTSESALSVTSFASALGLQSHMHRGQRSITSSDSSPSETRTGSSVSTAPSDVYGNQPKPFDPLNLGPLVHELPARTRQTVLELPDRIPGSLDDVPPDVPPIPAALLNPDSPPDPAGSQGSMAQIAERPEEAQTEKAPSPSPRRHMHRAATAPIPRTPTRSTTRSKGKCKGCGEEIMGKSVSSSDGRLTGRYHRGCFVCFECHSPFQTADFYVMNNRPYCAQHYHERNGSLCSTCYTGIEGQYLETVDQNGGRADRRRFHPHCLQCRTCRVMLNGDYFEWNGDVYCERDAYRAAAAYYPPPPGRRRPTIGSSPLSQTGEFPPAGYPLPRSPVPGLRPGPRYPSGGARRFPERRTTRLMMF